MRKKGRRWTREEHMRFLIGVKRLGRGDWKGISSTFVCSKTAAQVSSHAQKYYLWKSQPYKPSNRSTFFNVMFTEPTLHIFLDGNPAATDDATADSTTNSNLQVACRELAVSIDGNSGKKRMTLVIKNENAEDMNIIASWFRHEYIRLKNNDGSPIAVTLVIYHQQQKLDSNDERKGSTSGCDSMSSDQEFDLELRLA